MKASITGVIGCSCENLGKRCIDKRLVEIKNFRSCRIAQPAHDLIVSSNRCRYGRLFASVYGDFVVDFMVFTKW